MAASRMCGHLAYSVVLASQTAVQFPQHRMNRATNLRYCRRQRGFRDAELSRPVSDLALLIQIYFAAGLRTALRSIVCHW
jgi:hypothetical protein